MNLKININSVISNQIETYIIQHINLNPPGLYKLMTDSEIEFIQQKVFDEFNFKVVKQLIISIKSSWVKNHIIKRHHIFKKHLNKMIIKYIDKTDDILKLCEKYDFSPMTILRAIFEKIYKMKFSNLITVNKTKFIITDYDMRQLDLALKSDNFNQLDQTNIHVMAENFESEIEKILIKHNIKHQTQLQLTEIQKSNYGKAINTPDFLILDDLIINDHKIKWIDAKNFYGANIPFIKSKITKQIKKYISEYGSGCIIFSLGFNELLNFPNVLLLDVNDISKI